MKQGNKVLVTGGTGFVGNRLVNALVAHGDTVHIVTRHPNEHRTARAGVDYVAWLPDVSRYDVIVHLAGKSILTRKWSGAEADELVRSRVGTAKQIVAAIGSSAKRPRLFVSASAVGFYGDRGDEVLTESSQKGAGFLADLAEQWEAEALRAEAHGVRTVCLRIGAVLGPQGGMIGELLPIFRAGLGGPVAGGRQWLSWIHWRDLVALLLFALDHDDVRGVLNAVAPNPETNATFTRALADAVKRPALLPVPAFLLKLKLGDAAAVALQSQRAVPERAQARGFQFKFPSLAPALADVLA
ncbi:MAG: TIGR01777 family oxidoreductase [Planctomycetes bacterium]|nr:TIGR01777 family oxidoreductase [Planctomycetota bacterium]